MEKKQKQINADVSMCSLTTKQRQDLERRNIEIHIHNTNIMNNIFVKKLVIDELESEDQSIYDEEKHDALYWTIRQLSSEKMSVFKIYKLLQIIFKTEELSQIQSKQQKIEILKEKFKFLGDLAQSCKVSVKELLQYSSKKIYSKITETLLIHQDCIYFIEEWIGVDFYKMYILPQSWFHLMLSNKLDLEKLDQLMSIGFNKGESLFQENDIKKSLHFTLSQIATSQKLNDNQKKQMLIKMKQIFGFVQEKEWIDLYKSCVKDKSQTTKNIFFESKILQNIIRKLGISKKYLLEDLLIKKDKNRVLLYYMKENYLNTQFFKKQHNGKEQPSNYLIVIEALKFLQREIKLGGSIENSDFSICFLECFEELLQPLCTHMSHKISNQDPFQKNPGLQQLDQIQRQNLLMKFIRIVEIIFTFKLCENQNFRRAIIYQVIYVLKIGIEDEDIVEMSIYSLQTLLNAIGIIDTINHLDKFFSIAVSAFLKYSHLKKIKNYVKRIFEFYLVEKKSHSKKEFINIQFIFLNSIKNNQNMEKVVQIFYQELYSNEKSIASNLLYHINNLKNQSEDLRILGVQYLLEIIEQKDMEDPVRKKLVEPKILKQVYTNVIQLKQNFNTEKNVEFSVLCGKVIAAIGLNHSFVNDDICLKATNQKTLINDDDEDQSDQKKEINMKSDYYNPLTNFAQNDSKSKEETLERLAFPILGKLQVEREDFLKFAGQLYMLIQEVSFLADDQPKNYYYSQFLLHYQINEREIQKITEKKSSGLTPEIEDKLQKLNIYQNQFNQIKPAVIRYINHQQNKYNNLHFDINHPKNQMQNFCYYLINKIEDEMNWHAIFKAVIPAIKQNDEIRNILIPYLLYFALRFNESDINMVDSIAVFFKEILNQNMHEYIDVVLKSLDFLNVCLEQDKLKFKEFIEVETKFKYVEKLFLLEISDESKTSDQNIQNFIKTMKKFPIIRQCFLAVQKIQKFKSKIDRETRVKGAQKIMNFKRCIFNFEENFRNLQQLPGNQGKDFMNILNHQDTLKVVDLYKKINPHNFDCDFFNNIVKSNEKQQNLYLMQQQLYDKYSNVDYQQNYQPKDVVQNQMQKYKIVKQNFENLMKKTYIIDDLKNQNWKNLDEWFGDFNLMDLQSHFLMIQTEFESKITNFEMILCLVFSEYHKGLQEMLKNNDTIDNQKYNDSFVKMQYLLKMLYHNFMLDLTEEKETSYDIKLFLHVIYEIDCSMRYLKDVFYNQKEQINAIINNDLNKEKRKIEKIYFDLEPEMKMPFENLLCWFEERTQSNVDITECEALMLIYQVRKLIFSLYDRENEKAIYMMKIAKLERKKLNPDILKVNHLFQECEKLKHKIIDFEYEYAKFLLKKKNAHDAFTYLNDQIETIKTKCDKMYKETRVIWLPDKIVEKSQLLIIELEIKIDFRNPLILGQFQKFVKEIGSNKWEKPFFKFGLYLDQLDQPPCGITQPAQTLNDEDKKKRVIQKIFYYIKSLEEGHKYIWQSLPRALQLWFDYKDEEKEDSKIQLFMKQELQKLQKFKLATALQILLSRHNHSNPHVRETIQMVLSQLACEYPGQSAWWIFHFLYFEEKKSEKDKDIKQIDKKEKKKEFSRGDFAKEVLNKITEQDKEVSLLILECEKLFFELKKLSEKQPVKNTDNQMDMPTSLQRVQRTNLVMPIEDNLSVRLPQNNYGIAYQLFPLVSSTVDITIFNEENVQDKHFYLREKRYFELQKEQQEELKKFSAYKEDPVMIQSFQTKVTIMHSKEKPKKIGIIGSNGANYNFLLKCDKYGDLRKEQRFIDFAVLCNKILQNDAEARKRNLRLRTYAIVPLSKNTGLIEWIQNTQTLKSIVGDYWKKNNVKGEMQDIKKKAQEMNKGEDHTIIWQQVKTDNKPVLGQWLSEHFPSPEIWYEAKINFVKSTAIWSIIGYVIGLGDRHGDNILIHSHTGEVTHVDFDCIFEKGAKLRVPEIVPFRLTQNIVDAFGIFGEKGVFQKSCEIVLRVMRKNTQNIRSFLFSFIHDPLIEASSNLKVEIKDALSTVTKKLNGQISNSDSGASASIEDQVEQVILNAINDESLKKMYIGWMPWL